jgi:hypothetical protein
MAFTNLATKLFGDQAIGLPLSDGFPYLKFAWEVEMSVGSGGEAKGLSFGPLIAKTCELPRFSVETQVVNVYNHKTLVQTKMNYEPITMTFYDQTNSVAESMIWEFVKGQFDTGDASKKVGIAPMVVIIKMKNLSGGDDKIYTLSDAYITDAQHDTLDYATSEPVLWTITLRYEDLQTNEFKGKTPGDGGSGIKPLPNPPSKPSINKITKVPVTKPPKADALIDLGTSKWKQAGGEENGPLGAAWGNPNLTKQSANHRNKTQTAPEKTTFWPSPLSTNKDYPTNPAAPVASRPAAGWQAQQVWDSKYASGWNADGTSKKTTSTGNSPSTGAATPPVIAKTADVPVRRPLAKDTVEANKEFVKQETENMKNTVGYNAEYKKAYLEGLERYPPRSPSLNEQKISTLKAETYALSKAPRMAGGTRTQNPDGTVTFSSDIMSRTSPTSVNNNPSAANSQANKEQQYVNKGKKPLDF